MNAAAGLLAARVALGPVLLPQSRWVKRNALRLPEAAGPRQGKIGEGKPALRVLVVGDSSAAGVGVADQAQALALPLARILGEQLGTAVSWQLIAQSGIGTREARDLLQQARLHPADVVVTALGVNDVASQASASRFLEQTELLWSELRQRTGATWAVMSGLPPMQVLTAVPHPLRWYLGRYAAWLDASLRRWAGEQGLGYCAMQFAAGPGALAADGFHPGPGLYPQWARGLARIIIEGRDRWAAQPSCGHNVISVRPEPVEGPDSPELGEGPEPVEGPDSPELGEGPEPVEGPDSPELAEGLCLEGRAVEAPVAKLR
jgi:lysophospholipase L1-like esterase